MADQDSTQIRMVGGVQLPKLTPEMIDEWRYASQFHPRMSSLDWCARKRPRAFPAVLKLFSEYWYADVAEQDELLPLYAWQTLVLIGSIDRLRVELGEAWKLYPPTSTWTEHLLEHCDDVVLVYTLLRRGLTAPALAVARTLLERWTLNVAHHHGIERAEEEQDTEFISRVWRAYGHTNIAPNVGEWWAWASDLLHGRVSRKVADFAHRELPIDLESERNVGIHQGVAEIVELVLRQIRGGLTVVAEEAGLFHAVNSLQAQVPTHLRDFKGAVSFDVTMPLDYFQCYRATSEAIVGAAKMYRSEIGAAQSDSPFVAAFGHWGKGVFVERRGRAIERARGAFDRERAEVGAEFDPGRLAARLYRYVTIAQMGRQIAELVPAERQILAVATQCLEGAMFLWLEDSDHSLASVRVLLEQTARLRTRRLKPGKARVLDLRGNTSAHRWLAAAGWGRLAAVLRATSEFGHFTPRSRRGGARQLLIELQNDVGGPSTARGAVVDSVAYMFAFEVHARLKEHRRDVADAFTESVTLVDEVGHLQRLEEYLMRGHDLRSHDFGEADAKAPSD